MELKYFNIIYYCFVITFVISFVYANDTTQYRAIIQHYPQDNLNISKREIEEVEIIGNVIINNTLNENGEVTVSLCDITRDRFGGINSYTVFNIGDSVSVTVASAGISASMVVNVFVDGCLQFFYNPCCENLGLRFVLSNPVILSAAVNVGIDLEVGGIGTSGSKTLGINPLNYLNLAGFSPVLGSWSLPDILKDFSGLIKTTNKSFCAKLSLPGNAGGLNFCVELQNFTANLHVVTVCPRISIYAGISKLFEISYTSPLVAGQCLSFSLISGCARDGSVVPPSIIQLFKSIDSNKDFILSLEEVALSKALLGQFNSKSTNTAEYSRIDKDGDGQVDFDEFQGFTTVQTEAYEQSPYSAPPTSYSPGDIALAVMMTMLATALVVGAALVVFAQYKGIVKIEWLGKVMTKLHIPTNEPSNKA